MKLGEHARIDRCFTQADIDKFAALGGALANGAVPEPLIAALFSYLLGVRLPGPGTNYLKQSLEFRSPAPLNAPLTARVTVMRLRPEKSLVDLETVCLGEDGVIVCTGRALVRYEPQQP